MLSTDQTGALETALPERYQTLVLVGVGLGPRSGEALGLTIDRVDFLRRRVEIDRQLVSPPDGSTPALASLKTDSSARTVPLSQVVAERLARHIEEHGTGEQGLLFSTAAGDPIRRQQWGALWRAAVKASGLPTGTRYHDLRHTFASMLIANGVSVRAVAGALGHADAGVTLRVYAQLWPSDEDRTRDAIDAALEQTAADSTDFSRTQAAESS